MNGLFKAYFVPWAEKNVNMSQLDARSKIVKYPIFFKSSILPCILSTIPTEPKKNGVLRNISLLKSLALHPPISRERPSVPIPSVPIPSVPTPSVPTPSVPTPSVPTLKPTPKPKPSQSKPPSRPTKPSSQPQGVVIRKNDPKKQHPQPLPPDQRVRSLNQLRALFGEKAKSEIRNRVKTYAELKSYKLGKRM